MSQVKYTEIRQWLKRYGYLPNVPLSKLRSLDSDSNEIRSAAMRMQLLFGSEVVGVPDGVIGDRTIAAMLLPRCGHPDFVDDPEVQAGRKAMQAGSGSWPAACHETAIRVSIDERGAAISKEDIAHVWSVSQREYANVGVRLVRVNVGDNAHIRQSWRSLGGNTIGLAEYNNRSCADSVFNYRSSTYRAAINYQINLDMHELGHNHNLGHTNGGIMNPSINNSPNKWVEFDADGRITYRDVSYATLARYFGGGPIDPPEPPENKPPTIKLFSPTYGQEFESDAVIKFTAEAKDDNGLKLLQLTANGREMARKVLDGDTTSQWSDFLSASLLPAGPNVLAAIATDSDSKRGSDTTTITVKHPTIPDPPIDPPDPPKPPVGFWPWLRRWLDVILNRTLKP